MSSKANRHQVIVIGAGISGLKAAIDLHRNGVDTIILEARDRLGGRLHSEKLGGVSIDFGASWFHDCLTNPLLKKNLNNPDVQVYFDDQKSIKIGSEGVIDDEPGEAILEEFTQYVRLKALSNPDDDDSIHNMVNQYILDKKQFLTKEQIELAPRLTRYFELWFGSCWDQTSALACCDMEHNGRNAFLTSGYYSVYANELKEFPRDRIFTNKIVNKIEQKDGINIKCTDGSTYHCQNIVVTIPQLCLTSTDYSIPGSIEWVPSLPKSLTSIFPKMSFSALGKVAFEFDEIFWSMEYDRFSFLGDVDHKSVEYLEKTGKPLKYEIFPENGILKDGPKTWQYPVLFINLARFSNKPVIVLLMQAPVTQYIESQTSDEKIWEYFEPLFQKLGSGSKKPLKLVLTKWTQDPFARGSYMGGKVGGDYEGSIELLVKGLPNVRFAGEHTTFEGNGCVHGAWLSGKREAEYILKKYNKL